MDLKVATHNVKLMDVIVYELCQTVFRPRQAYLQTLYVTKRIHRTKKEDDEKTKHPWRCQGHALRS